MTNTKITVCIPVASQRGGAELALMQLLQEGRDRSIDWDVIYFEDGTMVEATRQLGIPVQVILSGRLRNLPSYLRTVSKLKKHYKENNTDIAIGWMSMAHLYSGVAAYQCRIPAMWFQMGSSQRDNTIDRLTAAVPAKVTFVCGKLPGEAQVQMNQKTPVKVIHLAVDLNKNNPDQLPSPVDMRAKLGIPGHEILIGMVSRLQRWKGVHTLLKAMPDVISQYPDIHCVIVGGEHSLEAEYTVYLKSLINELNLASHVSMVGYQKNTEEWMQAMDLVIHASDHEPFGMVIVEAMALGKPVIAGSKGGPSEIITDGVDGLLSEYDDHKMLAENICRILGDQELAENLAVNARKRAQHFSTEKYAARLIESILQYGRSSVKKLDEPLNTEATTK